MGIGPSAHSFDGQIRSWNIAHNITYLKAIQEGKIEEEMEELSQEDKFNEFMMTRLRLDEGVSLEDVKKFGQDYLDSFRQINKGHEQQGLTQSIGGRVILTSKGQEWADSVAADYFMVEGKSARGRG